MRMFVRRTPNAGLRSVVSTLCIAVVVALGIASASAFVAAGSAHAEESWGYDIAHDLMSPYCPGRTLATCPSPQAAELVQWIVMQEAAGVTREQVMEMLVERFGDEILGAPKAEGVTLWAYIMPVLGFLVGGGAAFLVLRRIVGGGASSKSKDAPPSSGPTIVSAEPTDGASVVSDDDLARIVDSDLELRA